MSSKSKIVFNIEWEVGEYSGTTPEDDIKIIIEDIEKMMEECPYQGRTEVFVEKMREAINWRKKVEIE